MKFPNINKQLRFRIGAKLCIISAMAIALITITGCGKTDQEQTTAVALAPHSENLSIGSA
jgi:hypothetical protein